VENALNLAVTLNCFLILDMFLQKFFSLIRNVNLRFVVTENFCMDEQLEQKSLLLIQKIKF